MHVSSTTVLVNQFFSLPIGSTIYLSRSPKMTIACIFQTKIIILSCCFHLAYSMLWFVHVCLLFALNFISIGLMNLYGNGLLIKFFLKKNLIIIIIIIDQQQQQQNIRMKMLNVDVGCCKKKFLSNGDKHSNENVFYLIIVVFCSYNSI